MKQPHVWVIETKDHKGKWGWRGMIGMVSPIRADLVVLKGERIRKYVRVPEPSLWRALKPIVRTP